MNFKASNRPPFLTALCILTFIGSTFGFISCFLASLFFERTTELIIKYSSWHSVDSISPLYFITLMILFSFSLVGAIRIWKLHRNGIYIYSISQITILLIPAIWINTQALSATNAIATGVFILGYTLNWKVLN